MYFFSFLGAITTGGFRSLNINNPIPITAMETALFLNMLGSFVSTLASLFPGVVSTMGIFFGTFCQILSFNYAPASFISAMSCFVLLWTLAFNHGKNTRNHYIQAGLIGLGLICVIAGYVESTPSHPPPPLVFMMVGSMFGVFSVLLWDDAFVVMPGLVGGFTNTMLKMVFLWDEWRVVYGVLTVGFASIQLLGMVWLLEKWGPEVVNCLYVGSLMGSCVVLERVVFEMNDPLLLFYVGVVLILVGCIFNVTK